MVCAYHLSGKYIYDRVPQKSEKPMTADQWTWLFNMNSRTTLIIQRQPLVVQTMICQGEFIGVSVSWGGTLVSTYLKDLQRWYVHTISVVSTYDRVPQQTEKPMTVEISVLVFLMWIGLLQCVEATTSRLSLHKQGIIILAAEIYYPDFSSHPTETSQAENEDHSSCRNILLSTRKTLWWGNILPGPPI